jgi:hypothetical protein
MKKKTAKMTISGVSIYLANKRSVGDELSNKCYNGIPIRSRKCHIDISNKKSMQMK